MAALKPAKTIRRTAAILIYKKSKYRNGSIQLRRRGFKPQFCLKKSMIRFIVLLLHLCIASLLSAQSDAATAYLMVRKGRSVDPAKATDKPSKTAFYIFKNCLYDYDLDGGLVYAGRLIDVKPPDTLVLTTAMNAAIAGSLGFDHDTLVLPLDRIKRMRFIGDRVWQIYEKINPSDFTITVRNDSTYCCLRSGYSRIYLSDTSLTEIVPYHTMQGIDWLYERKGNSYYYRGMADSVERNRPVDTAHHTRYAIWPTPFYSGHTTIHGIAAGFWTRPPDDSSSIRVNGISAEAIPMTFLHWLVAGPDFPFMDSLEFYREKIEGNSNMHINGIGVGLSGVYGEAVTNGLIVGGFSNMVDQMNGLTVSMLGNTTYVFRGICIAGLRNRSSIGRGIQFGLFNRCTDLKGFQIGLWNRNGKRALPFINWSF
jgi:hypothetical protein